MHYLRDSWIVVVFGIVVLGPAACDDTGEQNLPECDSHQWSEIAVTAPLGMGGGGGNGGGGGSGGGSGALFAGFCLSRTPSIDPMGRAACVAIEMQTTNTCACDSAKGRTAVTPEHEPLITDLKNSPAGQSTGWNCFCEVSQLTGVQGSTCQDDASAIPVDTGGNPLQGFCYVDSTVSPPLGDTVLTEGCIATERRLLRFVGPDLPAAGASIYAVCADEQCD